MSAFHGKNAETGRLGEFLEAVRAGIIPQGSYLLIESLDRLSRNKPRKAVRLLEAICEEDIIIVTTADGKVYTKESLDEDPMAFMWAFMISMRAHEESATKSRRGLANWENKRRNANKQKLTARAPAWLTLDRASNEFKVDAEKAAVVQRIYRLACDGVGAHKIAADLNRERVPVFGKGKHWHRSYVVKLLRNPAVIGTFIPHQIEHDEGKRRRVPSKSGPVENYYPPIIEKEDFARVQILAEDNPRRGKHATSEARNVLGGIARCPLCEATMTLVNKGKGSRYLACSRAKIRAGCKYVAVPYGDLERAIVEGRKRFLRFLPVDKPEANAERQELEQRLAKLDAEEQNLVDQIAETGPMPALSKRLLEIGQQYEADQKRLSELVTRAEALKPALVQKRATDLVDHLSSEPLDRNATNVLIRTLFKEAVVNWLEWSIKFEWRAGGSTTIYYDRTMLKRRKVASKLVRAA